MTMLLLLQLLNVAVVNVATKFATLSKKLVAEKWRKMILTAAQNYMSSFQWTIWIFAHQHMIHCKYVCIDRKVQQTISIMRFIDAHISTRHHKYLWFFSTRLLLSATAAIAPYLHFIIMAKWGIATLIFVMVSYYISTAFALNVYLLKLDFNKLFFSVSLALSYSFA